VIENLKSKTLFTQRKRLCRYGLVVPVFVCFFR